MEQTRPVTRCGGNKVHFETLLAHADSVSQEMSGGVSSDLLFLGADRIRLSIPPMTKTEACNLFGPTFMNQALSLCGAQLPCVTQFLPRTRHVPRFRLGRERSTKYCNQR
ncbi:hypothetical protein G7K_4785-t1 [Saitoella complicata NRRL Y-17804]|uniref:Uncharacterized protein n=1 Tax=Saitoella complicata (strain BCRC 22490 / CBS 7301 / JCM 7358 / NBRC 10748 / NRRL Y-17804) TaxID=698492 RepID=A0A0E9NLI9_SAICN|nr:hypothetical protein G7K_4785-t1 [Saitoella complicata NRRL Y-17804]